MRIHTFFDPVQELAYQGGEQLIEVWKYCWSKAGWEPVVLGMQDCDSELVDRLFDRTIMQDVPRSYALNCFLRWDAMSRIGGWMCDYDVMPIRFPPTIPTESVVMWQHEVPCLVSGGQLAYRNLVQDFLSQPELDQDMHVMRRLRYPSLDVVKTYTRPHWFAAPAIHFCNQVMELENPFYPRHQFIPGILERLSRGDVDIRPPS